MFSQLHFPLISFFFFFNDTATTEIYTLSLHDALPISTDDSPSRYCHDRGVEFPDRLHLRGAVFCWSIRSRSEEHTSELQSPCNLVCRLLLEKKNLGWRFAFRDFSLQSIMDATEKQKSN